MASYGQFRNYNFEGSLALKCLTFNAVGDLDYDAKASVLIDMEVPQSNKEKLSKNF